MDRTIQTHFKNLSATDKEVQYDAFNHIIAATNEKVDWAYEVWDQLKEGLTDPDNHQRARATQFLCNLAKSDPEKRMLVDFPAVWEVTKDKKFVTARHTLQAIWRIGLAGPEQREMLLNAIEDRFVTNGEEKNYTLIRYDMIVGLRKLYDETKEDEVKRLALNLIEKEDDPKYKNKYAKEWKNA